MDTKVLTPCRCMLCALVIGAGSLASCRGGGSNGTCLEMTITYAGSKLGAAYLRVASDDGGKKFRFASNAVSIQALIQVESGGVTCAGGGEPVDVPFTGDVWVDVAGTAASSCADVNNPNPLCKPSAGDPQAHQTGVQRFGQLTQVRFDVVDQP